MTTAQRYHELMLQAIGHRTGSEFPVLDLAVLICQLPDRDALEVWEVYRLDRFWTIGTFRNYLSVAGQYPPDMREEIDPGGALTLHHYRAVNIRGLSLEQRLGLLQEHARIVTHGDGFYHDGADGDTIYPANVSNLHIRALALAGKEDKYTPTVWKLPYTPTAMVIIRAIHKLLYPDKLMPDEWAALTEAGAMLIVGTNESEETK